MQFTSQLEQGDWYIVASWLCVVGTLILYGIGIAFTKFRHALARARARRRSARTPRPRRAELLRRAEIAASVTAVRPPASGHWSRVAAIVETGLHRIETMSACHAAAGRPTAAAAHALHRLIADCTNDMRGPLVASAAPPPPLRRALPAAVAEPLAA